MKPEPALREGQPPPRPRGRRDDGCPQGTERAPGRRTGVLRHVLHATPDAVRKALVLVDGALADGSLAARPSAHARRSGQTGAAADALQSNGASNVSDTARACVEIVLAEVLNNIVEHAFPAPQEHHAAARIITLDLHAHGAALHCTIRDEGAAMPALCLPPGHCPDLGTAPENLPEGGFGWFLIRSLTCDLRYVREPGCNRLSFAIPLDDRH